ncbi:laccase 14 [Roridomyces roridus]|uniref:Laccase 14 n=1 Tax=Roridomyces roridus TaxID=1738132 RepID=A0AAD7BC50_9AGAR|nr:laccase 14 [Roridomyces roridus]
MLASSLRLAALALLPSASYAAQVVFDLNIVNAQLAPDGFTRDTVVPNGTFPGPVFTVQKGHSVVIHTHNQLTDPGMRRSTSIHWHGFFQARTSGMDGPAFVNQCPIAPGTTFDYVFDTAGQTGNYWYHSHLSTQYCDGLRGAFVVYDPDDPLQDLYDVDDESTIITLGEWYHNLAPDVTNQFLSTQIIPIMDSVLINGKGRYNSGLAVPYAVITVKKGLRYRFRVFSLSCRPFMTLSFDNHTFDVMELDGVEHDPMPFQNADIYAAQRISLILNANQSISNYWPTPPLFDINGISYVSPSLPVLLQLLSGAAQPTDFMPSEQVIVLPTNAIVDIVIPGAGAHPFHLHGHNFDVVVESLKTTANYVNPPRRDVVPINGGNTTFRFFTGNPGAWFLHCHIDWHLEVGLAVVFGESPALNIAGSQSQIQTAQWQALCPMYDALDPEFQ